MSVFLIAQTPRAGSKNHCIVVPNNYLQLTSRKKVRERLSTAILESEGKDYIAVSQKVEQAGSSRKGEEILVLVGFDVSQLSASQGDEIRSKLKDYLSELDILVTQTIDWEKTGSDLLVPRQELYKWGQDEFFLGLPPTLPKSSGRVGNKNTYPTLQKNIFKRANMTDRRGNPLWLPVVIVAMLIVIIGAASVKKCTKADLENYAKHSGEITGYPTEYQKIPVEKYNPFLPEDCHVSDENRKALAEIGTLCEVEMAVENPDFFKYLRGTQCHDFLIALDEVNEDTFFEFVTESNKGKLKPAKSELERRLFKDDYSLKVSEQLELVSSVVEMRRQLRKLYNALLLTEAKRYDESVCLPFFTDEDAILISQLALKLGEIEDGNITVASYLKMGRYGLEDVVRQFDLQTLTDNLESLITKWEIWEIGTPADQKKARQELEYLLLNVCGENDIDELVQSHCDKVDQLEVYQTAKVLKMSDLVAFLSEDAKGLIEGLFGLEHSFDNVFGRELKKVVAIRNALRELDAYLRLDKPELVYLPLFSDVDAKIIDALYDRLKNVELVKSDDLLAGLRQIGDIAQQVDQKKLTGDLMKLAIDRLGECTSSGDIMRCVSEQLRAFSENARAQVLRRKIDELIISIEAVFDR